MVDLSEGAEPPLWQLVLDWLRDDNPLASEPWIRDRARIDETLAELYLLGERPPVAEVGSFLRETGAEDAWARDVSDRWRKRLANPSWRPRELARSGAAWVLPFYASDRVTREHGLRSVPERLAASLESAALDYMRKAAADPASAGASAEAQVFALTARAVRLWALSRDSVSDVGWPSVMSHGLSRRDKNLVRHLTNAGRALEREELDRYAAEHRAAQQVLPEGLTPP
jgi:hypothetical protein